MNPTTTSTDNEESGFAESERAFASGPWKGLSPNVIRLGIVSLFADISSEMLYPLTPLFLIHVLGAPVAALGLIEGFAEALGSGLKATFGRLSDRMGKRKSFIGTGYTVSAVAKPVIAFAGGWPLVFFARAFDRFGKAMRGAPRDALLADSVSEKNLGKAFGWHRSFDTIGAILGPLIAIPLLGANHEALRHVYLWALLPGLVAAAVVFSVHESRRHHLQVKKVSAEASSQRLSPNFYRYLFIWGLFSLANSSDMFLILRANELGATAAGVILIYCLHNVVYAAASPFLGELSDRVPRRWILTLGFLVFAGVYAGFAVVHGLPEIVALYLLYGIYSAGTDGVGKAMALDFIPREMRGRALGLLGTVTSLGALISSVVAGVLWSQIGPSAAFYLGAIGAALAAILMLWKPFTQTHSKTSMS